MPAARIFGGDGVCTSSFTQAARGGVPAAVGKLFECTAATRNLTAYPGGRQFIADYKEAYGVAAPSPYAIYGYAAMQLGLQAVAISGS